MNAIMLGAKKVTLMFGTSFLSVWLVATVDPSPEKLGAFLVIAEISACLTVIVLSWQVIKPIKKYYENKNRMETIRDAEHRKLLDDLWERHPEDKEQFYLALGVEQFPKAVFYTGRK